MTPYFLGPEVTESFIGQVHELTPEQIAAARAHVLQNAEAVLAEHQRIEQRRAAGTPEVVEQARRTHEEFIEFRKQWAKRRGIEPQESPQNAPANSRLPTFREWIETLK